MSTYTVHFLSGSADGAADPTQRLTVREGRTHSKVRASLFSALAPEQGCLSPRWKLSVVLE